MSDFRNGVLLGLFVLLTLAAPASAEPNLLAHGQSSDLSCCPDESAADRCVELLSRDPSEKSAACAMVAGMSVLATPREPGGCHAGRPAEEVALDRSLISIPTAQMRDHGWYQDGAPKVMQAPALFPADLAAAGSAACLNTTGARPGELDPYQKACAARGGYESVHLYLSIAHDVSDQMAAMASVEDPWWKDKQHKDRVFLVRSEKRDEIQIMAANLLKDCKVVSYLYVSSHGSSGMVAWGAAGASGSESVGSFLKTAITPCLFSPGARIQFDGCSMGCGTGADAVRQGMNHIFDGGGYTTAGTRFPTADPFDGLEIYMNTDLGYNAIPSGFNRFFGAKARAYSRNGLGVVLSKSGGRFVSDIPEGKVPACDKDGQALGLGMFDFIARGQ